VFYLVLRWFAPDYTTIVYHGDDEERYCIIFDIINISINSSNAYKTVEEKSISNYFSTGSYTT